MPPRGLFLTVLTVLTIRLLGEPRLIVNVVKSLMGLRAIIDSSDNN